MQRLLESLEILERDENVPVSEYASKEFSDVIILLACDLLIDDDGNNTHFVNELRKYYDVFAVERDEVGWILGGIRTKKGIIVYG
jgi:hypothetical protein